MASKIIHLDKYKKKSTSFTNETDELVQLYSTDLKNEYSKIKSRRLTKLGSKKTTY